MWSESYDIKKALAFELNDQNNTTIYINHIVSHKVSKSREFPDKVYILFNMVNGQHIKSGYFDNKTKADNWIREILNG